MSTMVSIVARRNGLGWTVSYACAMSPRCAPGAYHAAKTYTLSRAASADIDQLLEELRSGGEPDGQLPSARLIGGQLMIRIDDHGFRHEYRRVGAWGKTLGAIEALLSPPGP